MVRHDRRRELEVESWAPIRIGRETIRPVSRSFIPARIEDNPHLMASGYKSRLQAMPEPWRSQLLDGGFSLAVDASRTKRKRRLQREPILLPKIPEVA